jgi:hypothetical protein
MKSLGFILLALVVLTGGLVAQGKPVPQFQIPAIREPHHFVKLDNRYVRVLDVTVPGYDSTLYHIHENPYFWVSIGAANLRGNVLGTSEILTIEKKDGEVSWSPEVTHRVGNIVAATFRNITVQIQGKDDVSPAGSSFNASPRATGYQTTAALDNELVHVERLILEPGQSTGKYTLPRSGILIAVHEGTVNVEAPGLPAARIAMKAGDFDWHTGPLIHTITNIGTARFEAVEAVWK